MGYMFYKVVWIDITKVYTIVIQNNKNHLIQIEITNLAKIKSNKLEMKTNNRKSDITKVYRVIENNKNNLIQIEITNIAKIKSNCITRFSAVGRSRSNICCAKRLIADAYKQQDSSTSTYRRIKYNIQLQ